MKTGYGLCLDDYQEEAAKYALYPGRGELDGLVYTALGLTGEAGEFADKVKKIIRDSSGILTTEARLALLKEIGDVLWYASQAAQELGATLGDVAEGNIRKLESRMQRQKLGGSGDDR